MTAAAFTSQRQCKHPHTLSLLLTDTADPGYDMQPAPDLPQGKPSWHVDVTTAASAALISDGNGCGGGQAAGWCQGMSQTLKFRLRVQRLNPMRTCWAASLSARR